MIELTTEQLIYLLYAKAYAKATEAATLTRSNIKSYLPNEWKEKAEKIYDDLKTQELIELKTKEGKSSKIEGRFSVTGKGNQALVANLAATNYDFTSSKSYKVLSTLLTCLLSFIKEASNAHPQTKSSEEMTFDEFQEKFKALYLEERKNQELSGVVAIHKKEILERFQVSYSATLSQETLEKYFRELKSRRTVFISKGEKDELIHWVE